MARRALDHGFGWQGLRRVDFAPPDRPSVRGRLVALADVPDLTLLPDRLPGRPAVTFRAGTEIAVQTLGLWLLSWPFRCFGLSAPRWLAGLLLPLQGLTRRLTSDRSAMSVSLVGRIDGRFVERCWTLVADSGHGPEIPTLAATLLAESILSGDVQPGARDAGALLQLNDFAPLFAGLDIATHVEERRLDPPLYRRVLGADLESMPQAVRRLHDFRADQGATGEATVARGANPLARLIAAVMRFPPAGRYPVHVAFTERDGIETWTRSFGRHSFRSHLSLRHGRLTERFEPLSFSFDLPSDYSGLEMHIVGWRAFGIPLPRFLAPRGVAREWQDEAGRFRFDVPIAVPLAGTVVHYSGWLELVE